MTIKKLLLILLFYKQYEMEYLFPVGEKIK